MSIRLIVHNYEAQPVYTNIESIPEQFPPEVSRNGKINLAFTLNTDGGTPQVFVEDDEQDIRPRKAPKSTSLTFMTVQIQNFQITTGFNHLQIIPTSTLQPHNIPVFEGRSFSNNIPLGILFRPLYLQSLTAETSSSENNASRLRSLTISRRG
ncbi:hypothetical protein BDZ45DRAFT_741739 [Acephala macrosclerotiorum]|nr:hypothetical protein BDZ45DRAFT_741739 [Acephala macrosclerotiorum]